MPHLYRSPRLSIRTVIVTAILTILGATSLLVYLTITNIRSGVRTHDNVTQVAHETVLLEDIRAEYLNEWLVLLSTRGVADERFVERFEQARARVDWAFSLLTENARLVGPEEEERVKELLAAHSRLVQAWAPVITAMVEGDSASARAAMANALTQDTDAFVDQLAGEVARQRLRLNEALSESEISRSDWEGAAVLIGTLWLMLLAAAGYAALRWVVKPLGGVAEAARMIAAGDFNARAPLTGPAEMADLAADVNMMAVSLIKRSEELSDYLSQDLEARTAALEKANDALTASEVRLNAVIESAPLILFALDREAVFTLSKGRGLAAFGLEPGAIDGLSAYDAFANNPEVRASFERAMAGESVSAELIMGDLCFDTHLEPLRAADGLIAGLMGVAVDVTQRNRAEEALRRSEERYRELFENATDIVYTHDLEGRITSMNKAGVRTSGFTESEMLGKSIAELVRPEMLEYALAMTRRKLAGTEAQTTYDIEIIAKDGRVVPLEVSSRLVFEGDQAAAVQGIARDISDRRLAEAAVRKHTRELEALNEQLALAHTDLAESKLEVEAKSLQLERALELERARSRVDSLTGGLNHGAIVEELRRVVSSDAPSAPAAVVMLDIDGMKAANDIYGHQFGDQVLMAVKDALSRRDAIVGRYGGDEFVAIVPGAGQTAAEAYRQEVLAAIQTAGLKDPEAGTGITIVVSIGYSLYPSQSSRIEELIALADAAMYADKRRRPVRPVEAATRRMGGERAVRVVADLVPALSSAGDPSERLAYVCERLAEDGGYDGVEIMMNPWLTEGRDVVVAYPPIPPEVRGPWIAARREYIKAGHPIPQILEKTHRPLIIDSPQEDPRMAQFQRIIMREIGMRSVMIAPMFWEGKLIGSISVASRQEAAFGATDAQILMGITSQVSAILSMAMLLRDFQGGAGRLQAAHRQGVRLLSWVVEAQAGVLSHDFERMRAVAESLARRLGYSALEASDIGLATMLHDVGKYRVPAEVLARPQDLTEQEFEVVKRHTVWGHRLLREYPAFELASHVARWHHERWDGHGYPDGLSADEIPLPVAIASVADALDAMVYDRVYRLGRAPSAALEELTAGSGSQFSPRVVSAAVDLYREGLLPIGLSEMPGRTRAA